MSGELENKITWIDEAFEGLGEVRGVRWSLLDLAKSLYNVGLDKLSEDLRVLSKVLKGAEDKTQEAISKGLNERFEESRASTAETLKFVLEVASRAKMVEVDGEKVEAIVIGPKK